MDKAARTAQRHINEDNQRIKVIGRLREKEFIARCDAVKLCHVCGNDWTDVESVGSHHVTLACTNKKCSELAIIKYHKPG